MNIAVEGCCHGELDKIYETMQNLERRDNIKIELLLCCGDFQSVRDEADLHCMACPDKYKSMQSFWQYYNGEKKAPYLTIFIGGNHEASNHLQELPYGGWVAPNIFYMGYANIVTYKGIRIGGISGIFKYHDYNKGHFEKPPYDNSTKRSVYHVRSLEVFRLKLLENPVDIMMSHDWPSGIVQYGNIPQLLRQKPFFGEDIQRNRLGSPPLMELVHHMKPKHWFSGHLHVKFTATVRHNPTPGEEQTPKTTNFLALDKCLPRRQFLQVVQLKTPENVVSEELSYDPEWLAVLRATNELISVSRRFLNLPQNTDGLFSKYKISSEKVEEVKNIFNDGLTVPKNFKRDIMPLYDPKRHNRYKPVQCKTSHQTTDFCNKLEINDPLMMAISQEGGLNLSSSFNNSSLLFNEDDEMPSTIVSSTSINEDEIDLGSDDDDEEIIDNGKDAKNGKTDEEVSVLSEKDNDASHTENRSESKPDSSIASSSLSSEEEESDNKTSSGSEANRGIMRLSLSLPAPVFGATSTPIRQQNETKITKLDTEDFIPLFSTPRGSGSMNSTGDVEKTKPKVLARNALILSLAGKRFSDPDSDLSESNSGGGQSNPRKFKRRNASFYTSQGEEDQDTA